MGLLIRDVDSNPLRNHPPAGDQYLNDHGSYWLWAVFAVFALSWLVFVALHKSARSGEKIFHYLFAVAAFVGLITYYAQASDLGWTLVTQVNNTNDMGLSRQIFYAKYIFWTVAFPTVIITLGLLSGVSWATIAYNVAISWIWIISYLVGAYTRTNYKWGFFVFGTVAYLWLAFNTLIRGRRYANRLNVGRDYTILAAWANLLWALYPIAWALSDGGNRIGVVGHFIWFGILDLLLIPGTGFIVLILSRKWDYSGLNLRFTQQGRIHGPHKGEYGNNQLPAHSNGLHGAAPPAGQLAAHHAVPPMGSAAV